MDISSVADEVVKYLISKGANITVGDNEPLIWAAENGQLDVIKYFWLP